MWLWPFSPRCPASPDGWRQSRWARRLSRDTLADARCRSRLNLRTRNTERRQRIACTVVGSETSSLFLMQSESFSSEVAAMNTYNYHKLTLQMTMAEYDLLLRLQPLICIWPYWISQKTDMWRWYNARHLVFLCGTSFLFLRGPTEWVLWPGQRDTFLSREENIVFAFCPWLSALSAFVAKHGALAT